MTVVNFISPTKICRCCVVFFVVLDLISILVNSYDAVELITINCGASSAESDNISDGRTWVGDVNPKQFILSEPQRKQQSVSADAPWNLHGVPYKTARLSHSEFTYSFALTDGQKFVRLHFYPASYPNFSHSNALFTVKAGPYILLKDFNASLTADNDVDFQDDRVLKEYCINVEPGQRLNITFTPSVSNQDAYAFINGIEIVSMPTNLYYSNDPGFDLVGENFHSFTIINSTALEMMYRINVGGKQIGVKGDTGMYRSWDQDNDYLKQEVQGLLPAGYNLKPIYNNGQNYIAPEEVYITARSYNKETSLHNITWEFEVDSQFFYMVRLHFCEFEPQIQNPGDRVFQVFIADKMAEPEADVIRWSLRNLAAVHRDYAVSMLTSKEGSQKVNLSIKLQPHPDERVSSYDSAILNGIEIFKISNVASNLAGPNPIPRPSPPSSDLPPEESNNLRKTSIVYIVVGAASGFVLLSIIGFLIFRRRRALGKDRKTRQREIALATAKSGKCHGSSLPSDLCRFFSLEEIRTATNDFDDVLKIGVGGFGNVYKGYIDDNTTPVAIKRLKPGSQQGAVEFKTEIEMLSQLRHLHLVSLIGYCDDGNEMILVYDFMARGTLREHLYDSDNVPLSWKQRLEILLGAAKGLHYLHTGAKYNIIHRDVKSTNILLDEKWVAKVSDFGLSKSEPIGMSKSHISTKVKGSFGYLDPEYYKRQRLTQKSDVYSFGVVLLEVLCGRPPLQRMVDKNQTNLVDWVHKCHKKGEIDRAIDPILRGTITPECLNKFIEMALNCLLEDGNQRPTMNDLVWGLEFALQLQETKEDNKFGGIQVDGKSEDISSVLPKLLNETSEESDVQFTSTNVSINDSKSSKVTITSMSSEEQALFPSGSVFSEIRDPSAR